MASKYKTCPLQRIADVALTAGKMQEALRSNKFQKKELIKRDPKQLEFQAEVEVTQLNVNDTKTEPRKELLNIPGTCIQYLKKIKRK